MVKSGRHNEQEGQINPESIPPYQMRYRWVILSLILLLYLAFGIVARSIAPLITPILRDLNISYTQMGTILGAWPLTYIVVALIGGAILDRWGIRKSLFIGMVIIGLSATLRYFANGFVTMFLCVALFGAGGPMISIGAPKTVSEWFRGKERGTAVGIYSMSDRIGGLIVFAMTNSVVMPLLGYSWRLTFVSYGIFAFVVALLWWFLAREVKSTEAIEKRSSIVKVFTGLIRVRNVRLILIMGFLSFSIGHGFNNWLPNILETGGLPPAVAGLAAAIPLMAGLPVVLIVPRMVPPHLRGHIIAISSFASAIALLAISITSGAALVAGLVFFGLLFTPLMPLLVLTLMDNPEVGPKYMGSAGGMLFCVGELGGAIGPLMMGGLVDLTGSFLAGASLLASLAVAVSVMALLLKSKPDAGVKAP